MSRWDWPRQRLLAAVAGVLVVLTALGTGAGDLPSVVPGLAPAPAWEYLSDRPWVYGDTGWLMVSYEGLPTPDAAFYSGGTLELGDHVYAKGLGCYSPSEVVYDLNGEFARFEGVIGVAADERAEPPGQRRVRFLVFADDTKVFESGLLSVDDAPQPVSISIRGADRLRLQTVREPGATVGSRCVWGDVRVQREARQVSAAARAEAERARRDQAARSQHRAANQAQSQDRAQRLLTALRDAAGGSLPAEGEPAVQVRLPNSVAMVNGRLAVVFGVSGQQQGRLTVVDRSAPQYVVQGLTAALDFGPQFGPFQLSTDGRADGNAAQMSPVADAALGEGDRMAVPYAAVRGLRVVWTATVFHGSAGMYLGLDVTPDDPALLRPADLPVQFRYVTADGGSLYTGADAHYLTDFLRLRNLPLPDDGIERTDYMSWGTPLYLYDPEERFGLIVASLDETRMPPKFSLQREPERVSSRLTLTTEPSVERDGPPGASAPDLYLEPVRGQTLQQAFTRYRALMAAIAPPPPLPDWLGPQWLSWYVYYMDQDEEAIVRQIDLISEHLGDLGPWNIIVDAGWYRAEGLPGAEWRSVDFAKFPRGIKWLVDYAHSKGVKVVLYYSAPYLNTNEVSGNWLGLRGIIDQHPEWVIPLDQHTPPIDYVYDFRNPELRAYMRRVLTDYFADYGVDGIKLDGLGSAGESVLVSPESGDFAISAKALEQTLEIYRFVYEEAVRHNPDVYIESGWVTPTLANRYSHTFRYGDEDPVFSRVYPLPGFMEHIDYAAYQQAMLGQRSNMGAPYGDPNDSVINRWWLQASLALGAQVSFSVDLGAITPESMATYRAMFAAYKPFTGNTLVTDAVEQQVFSTERGGVRYVGVLNRAAGGRTISVTPESIGLPAGARFTAFDVEDASLREGVAGLDLELQPESFRLLVVRSEPGALWGDVRLAPTGPLEWAFDAPPTVPGYLYLYAPDHATVLWDGEPLAENGAGTEQPAFQAEGNLVHVTFPAGGRHTLRIVP